MFAGVPVRGSLCMCVRQREIISLSVYACVRAYVHACVHACVCARVLGCRCDVSTLACMKHQDVGVHDASRRWHA